MTEEHDAAGPLCCACSKRIEDEDGVAIDRPYGLEVYHRACYDKRSPA